MSYSYIVDLGSPASAPTRLFWSPHVSTTSVYAPVYIGRDAKHEAPAPLARGTPGYVDRQALWHAAKYVRQLARVNYNASLPIISDAIAKMEAGAEAAAGSPEGCEAFADAALKAWWTLADDIVIRTGDNYRLVPATEGPAAFKAKEFGYPSSWLTSNAVGFPDGPAPAVAN